MASLSSLKTDVAPAVNPGLKSFYVTNNSISANNGGQCCLFTVPDGVTQVTFEMWGGGPPGAGACCCQQTAYTGSGGQYARRTIATAAGCTYTLCAAGSTCCCRGCNPGGGFTSYVSGSGIATTCAGPGIAGKTGCFLLDAACCTSCVTQGSASGDFCMPSVRGNKIQAGGCFASNKWYMGGAYQYGRFNGTRSVCTTTVYSAPCCWGLGHYPSGPGSNGITCGGPSVCGTPGYGGMIKVTYG